MQIFVNAGCVTRDLQTFFAITVQRLLSYKSITLINKRRGTRILRQIECKLNVLYKKDTKYKYGVTRKCKYVTYNWQRCRNIHILKCMYGVVLLLATYGHHLCYTMKMMMIMVANNNCLKTIWLFTIWTSKIVKRYYSLWQSFTNVY